MEKKYIKPVTTAVCIAEDELLDSVSFAISDKKEDEVPASGAEAKDNTYKNYSVWDD